VLGTPERVAVSEVREAMRENALSALQTDAKTEKRAQFEAFEFAVAGDVVQVTNGSHQDPDEHTYKVQLDERGVPTSCTCGAYEYHPGACKHMTAVAIREPVLEAARAARDAPQARTPRDTPRPRADGGMIVADDEGVILEDGEDAVDEADRPDDCQCTPRMEDLACHACWMAGFEEPSPDATRMAEVADAE